MKNRAPAVLTVIFGLLMVSAQAFAHHSDSVYDQEHLITVAGTVTRFEFANPHVQIHFEVKNDKGNIEQWIALGGSPAQMRRVTWNSSTFKPGEQLTLSGFRFRDGRNVMLQLKTVRQNGEVVPASEAEVNFLNNYLQKHGAKQ